MMSIFEKYILLIISQMKEQLTLLFYSCFYSSIINLVETMLVHLIFIETLNYFIINRVNV